MTEGEWVSAKETVERLEGLSDDPREFLLRLVQKGGVNSRSSSVCWDDEGNDCRRYRERNSDELKSQFWQAVSEKGWQDWIQSNFGFNEDAPADIFGAGDSLLWSATGVEFNWADISPHLVPLAAKIEPKRGKLPDSAKPNHRTNEGLAHAVALVIQSENIDRAKAIRKIVDQEVRDPSKQPSSVEMAVRRTFDLMYHPNGTARQN